MPVRRHDFAHEQVGDVPEQQQLAPWSVAVGRHPGVGGGEGGRQREHAHDPEAAAADGDPAQPHHRGVLLHRDERECDVDRAEQGESHPEHEECREERDEG